MPFHKNYDIVVVGGGVSGIAAALAAARAGKKVALIEKTVLLGGLATTGLIYIYLPLCDGYGQQVTFGIAEELLKLSIKYGPGNIPEGWGNKESKNELKRLQTTFSPASFILAIDEVLQEANIDVWLDSLVCDTILDESNKITEIVIENDSGRGKIKAKCFIDASGSALLVRRSGGEVKHENNSLAFWAQERVKNNHNNFLADNIKITPYGSDSTDKEKQIHKGICGKMTSDFILKGRKLLLDHYKQLYKQGIANRFDTFPLALPAMAQFRKIAAIKGEKELHDDQHGVYVEDSIGIVSDWRKSGLNWEIPFGTMLPVNLKGVLVAGRSIASFGDAWEVTRVIPAAALTGEVAGIAASIAVEKNIIPKKINIKDLQQKLYDKNFKLHLAELGLEYK